MAQNPNLAHLDGDQVIKRVFNPLNDSLRVDATVTASVAGPTEVVITHVDDSIKIGDGTNLTTTTTVGADTGLDVNVIAGAITGEFVQTGLHIQGRVTTMNVTSTATTLPSTALTDRNSLALTNLSTIDTLYIGFSSSVTANQTIGTNAGWEVGPNEGFQLDIQDNIVLYGITETGKTVKIKIMELA